MWNPLSWVMEAAAIMAIALANGSGKPPDWQDFVGIICLLVINSTISFIEENIISKKKNGYLIYGACRKILFMKIKYFIGILAYQIMGTIKM